MMENNDDFEEYNYDESFYLVGYLWKGKLKKEVG